MKRDKFPWFCICIRNSALLGILTFLLEVWICEGQVQTVQSGAKWPPYSSGMTNMNIGPHAHLNNPVQSVQSISAELPQIHSPQTRLTVQNGDTISLPCKVHNLGESQVLWRHRTNILAGSNVTTYADSRIQLLEDCTLQISRVTRNDDGEYECIVTSWPQLSLVHTVIVQDAPTVSLLTPTNIVATEGETVEIGCIPHGNPLPKINWSMRDGVMPIARNLLNQSHLLLERVTRKYTGLWVCTADNGVGRPAIGAVYVRVLYSPEVEIPKSRVHGGIGFKAQLVGLVHADPAAEVHWRRGQDIVQPSDRVIKETQGKLEYRLIFNPVKASDFGTYTLEANNSMGFDVKVIEFLGVPNAPILSRWEAEDIEGIQVTLYWAVECYSALIDYKLFFRSATIPLMNSSMEDKAPPWTQLTIPADKTGSGSFLHTKSFTLRGLNESSIYEAAVKARNKYGWSPLSSVCYFATFPNSSSSRAEDVNEIIRRVTEVVDAPWPFQRGNGFSWSTEPSDAPTSTTSANSISTFTSAILLISVLLICEYHL